MVGKTRRPQPEPAIEAQDVVELAFGFGGELVSPPDPEYEKARKVWNGMVDKHPALIAFCKTSDDVIQALEFSRSRSLPFSVRAGGHNVAGNAVCDQGLVIDLSRMKGIRIDETRRVARAEAGLMLGELDAATQASGLATTMGVNSDTGVAGLTLGGGFGRLGRKHGLACDNLVAAEVVTADGRLVRASAGENADLFWGIRGGGGNFGIATAFEFQLHPVGPEILHASLTFDWAHARDALRAYHALAAGAPDEVSADAALATGPSGEPIFNASVSHMGPVREGAGALEALLRPLRSRAKPIDEQSSAVSYLELQSAADSIFPRGRRYYWKAQLFRQIDDPAIEVLLEKFPTAPSAGSIFVFQHLGGAISRVPPPTTAYVNRDALYDGFPIAIWDSPQDDAANIEWARDLWAALAPSSTGGVYVNSLGEEGERRVRAAYGDNYSRLVSLKRKYDPANLFSRNQNIKPTA